MKKLLIFLLVLAGLFLAGGLLLPTEVHVERSMVIERPPATVFAMVNGYRTFNQWSPWAGLDPDAEFVLQGPATGVGARMEWTGDPALVGTGWQEITASTPFERVETHLDFGPQGRADSYFDIHRAPSGSRVTWGFDTDVSEEQGFFGALLGRYFGLMLDRWVGADYEQGLAALKAFAESLPPQDFSEADIALLEVQPMEVLIVSGEADQTPNEIAAALANAYGELTRHITQFDLEVSGQPMAITRAWDNGRYVFDAAIPVAGAAVMRGQEGNVRAGLSPGGPAARIVHVGSYAETISSYEKLATWMAAHGWREGSVSWEHYISDPGEVPEAEIITHIYFQVEDGVESG